MMEGDRGGSEYSVLWQMGSGAGLEHASLMLGNGFATAAGNIITRVDSIPITVQYQLEMDEAWRLRAFRATAMYGTQPHWRLIQLSSKGNGHWFSMQSNGERTPAFSLSGCLDILPAFSPIGYLLPVRRLGLAIGETAEIDEGWVTFPAFAWERRRRRYTRIDSRSFRCESPDLPGFHEFSVEPSGLVLRFGEDLWRQLGPDDPQAL